MLLCKRGIGGGKGGGMQVPGNKTRKFLGGSSYLNLSAEEGCSAEVSR